MDKIPEAGFVFPLYTIGTVSQMDLVRYAGASGDFNPIHNDPEYAREAGLSGTIAHGMLIKAYMGRFLLQHFPLSALSSFSSKFKAMTKPGETIEIHGTVKKNDAANGILILSIEVRNQAGETKATAEAVIRI